MSDSAIPKAEPVQSAPSAGDMARPTETPAASPAPGSEPTGSLAPREEEPGRLTDSQLEDLLFADPFAKEPTPQGSAAAPPTPSAQKVVPEQKRVATPAAPTPGPQGQAPVPPAAVQTPPAPTPDPRDQELAALRADLQQQRILMQTFIGQQGQQPQGQAPQQQVQQGPLNDPSIPAYLLPIPEELANAVASEDPTLRRAGLQALVQGALKSAHFEIMKTVRAEMEQVVPQRVSEVTARGREQDGIRNDYFSAFPTHRTVAELVGSVTKQVFAETGAQQWSPVIRNAIGQRVNLYLSQAVPPQQAPQQVSQVPQVPVLPAASQPAQAPFIFGTSASPAVGPASGGNPNSPVGIFDTLFG